MSKYFQGKIEYTTKFSKNEQTFSETIYMKDGYCRTESDYLGHKSIYIYTPEQYYKIDIEEQKIVDFGSLFDFENYQIELKELDESEIILGYPCVAIELKGKIKYDDELDDESEEIDMKHFVNKDFKINPSFRGISNLLTDFLSLRIEYDMTILDVHDTAICQATKMEIAELPMDLFDVNSFENFKRLTYQEYEAEEDKKYQEEKRKWKEAEEKWQQEFAELTKRAAEEGKIITAKVAAFLETEFQRELTPEEKENASQLFLDLVKTLSEEEASALSKRLLNSM